MYIAGIQKWFSYVLSYVTTAIKKNSQTIIVLCSYLYFLHMKSFRGGSSHTYVHVKSATITGILKIFLNNATSDCNFKVNFDHIYDYGQQ